jgi:signal transduction histidine kinase/ligand-binding sensor domain-containing protein/DNA-binding response OmpR family regulator
MPGSPRAVAPRRRNLLASRGLSKLSSTCQAPRAPTRLASLALALCLQGSFAASAARPQILPIFNLTTDDGLAASQVWGVHSDSRGYLWIATSEGLNRYDGVTLQSITAAEGLRSQVVRKIVEDAGGSLWLATSDGVARFDGRGFEHWGRAEGVNAGIVWDLAFDRHGTLWLGSAGGLGALRDGRIRWYRRQDGLAADDVYSLLVTSRGELWVGTRAAGLARCAIAAGGDLGACTVLGTADGLGHAAVRALAEDEAGRVYVGTRGGGVTRLDDRGAATFDTSHGLSGNDVYALLVNHRGELVVGTAQHGVTLCSLPELAACRTIRKANGLLTDSVLGLDEDREGNLWIGLNNGLSRLPTEKLQSFDERHGVPGPGGYSLLPEADGGVWVATFGGLARLRLAPGYATPLVERWTAADGLPSSETWDVLRDRSGRLWVATARGLCHFDPLAGRCHAVYDDDSGLAGNYLLELHESRDGDLWVGTLEGASRLRFGAGEGPEIVTLRESDGLPGGQVVAITEGPDGTIWLGSTGGGLAAFAGGRVRAWGAADGLPTTNIYGLHAAADGSLWIGTGGNGLLRMRRTREGLTFEPWGAERGVPARTVSAIRPDERGRLWVGSTAGVFLLDPAAYGGRGAVVRHFDRSAGLISKDVSTANSIAVDPQGDLWFGFSGGITHYDPDLDEIPLPPPVTTLERISVDGRTLRPAFSPPPALAPGEEWLQPGAPLTFPPGGNNLRFDFRGLSYRDKARYRYQLVGFDPRWSQPTTEPFKEYTNLDPGEYRFLVQAAGGRGAWGPPAELAFALRPALWQTPAFPLLALGTAALLLFVAHRSRTRRIEARSRELEAMVAERTDDLRRYARALEEHSHALDGANARIRQTSRFKTQFLANMSHELRTPLNAIVGFSQVLARRLDGRIEERELGFLANVRDSARHLLHLINNLLDLSKVEAGKMEVHVEQAELGAVVDGVCAVMEGYCRERDVTIAKHFPPRLTPIAVDIAKLKQVLFNLLSNAIKFSAVGGTVEVDARPLAAEESPLGVDSYEIAVIDHGVGIHAEDQETIFEEFRQIHHGGDRPPGTGLGLAIVHRFVTLLGGEVAVDSAPGRGATFRVHLPRQASDQGPPSGDLGLEPAPVRPRVLVIEDDRATFTSLAAILEDAGFLPVRARDGEEAVRVGREVHPAVVALDLGLPWGTGWAVLTALARDETTAGLPVVLLAMRSASSVGMAVALDACLLAPIDPGVLLAAVRRLAPSEARESPGPVLIVDDDPASRELLELAVAAAGLAGLAAPDRRRAIELARAHRPRAVVTGLGLPGGEGLRLAHALQRDARTAGIPLFGLARGQATIAERQHLARELAASAEGGRAELVAAIETVLRRQGVDAAPLAPPPAGAEASTGANPGAEG